MKEYSKGIYVKFKPEEEEILHDRMKEAGVQNMSAYIRKMVLNGYVIIPEWPDLNRVISLHTKAAVVVGAGTLIVGGGAIAYKKLKNREPAVLKEFRQALKIYLDAIRTGSLDVDVIDNMAEALYALKQHKNYEKFSIQLTAEDIETLVNKIQDYTVKLAADNDIVLEDIEAEKSDDAIINLETYLNVQKRVFEEAA